MHHLLINPVYNALLSGDAKFNIGNKDVKFFAEQVSPFASFRDEYENGFEELHHLLPQGRRILYANRNQVTIPKMWKLKAGIAGLQFVLDHYVPPERYHLADMQPGLGGTAYLPTGQAGLCLPQYSTLS